MTDHANYILSTYKNIFSLPEEQLLKVGYQMSDSNPIPSFDEDVLINLCYDAQKIFENEDNILEIDGDIIIVGDIHGSLHDLLRIFKYIEINKYRVLFLGDYVDRGDFSLECITLLLSLKILYPQRCFLIRGNHEFDSMCSQYGFKKEFHIICMHKSASKSQSLPRIQTINTTDENIINPDLIKDENVAESDVLPQDEYYSNYLANVNCYIYTEKLYKAFMRTFSYLPLCAIINNTSICIHGGLSPTLHKIDKIRSIQRPIDDFDDDQLLSDMLWSDPSHKASDISQLYHENPRGRGKLFTGIAIADFLKTNNFKRLIRAHECVNNGIDLKFNDKCITVFSASSYNCRLGNNSGILKIYQRDDRIEPISFPPLPRLSKADTDYYKVQPYQDRDITKPIFSVTTNRFSINSESFIPLEPVSSDLVFDKASSELNLNRGIPLNNSQSSFISNANTLSRPNFPVSASRKSRIMAGRYNINQNFAFNTGIRKRKNSTCGLPVNVQLPTGNNPKRSSGTLEAPINTSIESNDAQTQPLTAGGSILPRLVSNDES